MLICKFQLQLPDFRGGDSVRHKRNTVSYLKKIMFCCVNLWNYLFACISCKTFGMKYLLCLPVALLLCSFAFERDTKSPESVPPYDVTQIKRDANIPAGTAQIIFTFSSNLYGTVANDSIRLSYNGTEVKLPTSTQGKSYLGVKAGKYKFQFYYNSSHFEIETDSIEIKEGWQTGISVNFESSRVPVMAEKPVIYVYPTATQQINIRLDVRGTVGFTYPAYYFPLNSDSAQSGWTFTADPDGTIHQNGKDYDYLFWDAQHKLNLKNLDTKTGFIVQRDSVVPFFEKQLSAMNLSPREQQDFITYWCPRMLANEKSFVQFVFNENYDQFAGITITPKPDHVFRVMMLWKNAAGMNARQVQPQKIESVTREGFTVVEWGGTELPVVNTEP